MTTKVVAVRLPVKDVIEARAAARHADIEWADFLKAAVRFATIATKGRHLNPVEHAASR